MIPISNMEERFKFNENPRGKFYLFEAKGQLYISPLSKVIYSSIIDVEILYES